MSNNKQFMVSEPCQWPNWNCVGWLTLLPHLQEGFMGLDNAKYFGPGGEFRRLVEEHGHMRWTEHGGYQLTGLRTDVSPHLT